MAGYLIGGWSDWPNSARAWCSSTNLNRTVVTTAREHNQAARLELPTDCIICECDRWETAYGAYEYVSYFRCGSDLASGMDADSQQPDSRELIDRGTL